MTMKASVADYTVNNDKFWGIYRGVVENSKDPDRLCRCQVRVLGVHDELKIKDDINGIPTEELPWAHPCYGLFQGSISGNGTWMVPLQGSYVFVFFENGNWMQPRYFLSAPGKPELPPNGEIGFNDPEEVWPDHEGAYSFGEPWLDEVDPHRLMKKDKLDFTSLMMVKLPNLRDGVPIAIGGDWIEHPPMYQAKYPYNNVFHSYKGTYVEMDNTDENVRFHLYHPSNSYIEIGNEGQMTIRNNEKRWDIVMSMRFEETVEDFHRYTGGNRSSKVEMSEYEEIMMNSYRKIHINDRKDVYDTQWYYITNAEKLWLDGEREKYIGASCFEYVEVDKTTYVGTNTLKWQLGKYDTCTIDDTLKWMDSNNTKYVHLDDTEIIEGKKIKHVVESEEIIIGDKRKSYISMEDLNQCHGPIIIRSDTEIIIEAPMIKFRGGVSNILTNFTNIAGILRWNGIALGLPNMSPQVVAAEPEVPVDPITEPEKPAQPPMPAVPPFPPAIEPPPPPPLPPELEYESEPPEPDECMK